MNGFDVVIRELRGATADLRDSNNKSLRRKASKKPACTCAAYPFPHRKFGGKCDGRNHAVDYSTVSYHHTRQAMLDAGHSDKDFL